MFEFATASRIIFGPGSVGQVPSAAAAMGRRVLLVTGQSQHRSSRLLAALNTAGVESPLFSIPGEPTIDLVRRGVAAAREAACDLVIAIGGGSVIDGGKAIAALLRNPGDPSDYLEVVGKGNKLESPSAPFIAVPTTAGTGSEVTRNAVLGSPEHKVKASLRSPFMLPSLAVVDPDLTVELPPAITASTGLDALTQLIEPYVSVRANPLTDVFCLDGMRRAAHALPRVFDYGHDREARKEMAFASLLGGLSLANAALGAVHALAAPIGGEFPAPHGAVCAALLPHAMEANIRALRARDAAGVALERYTTVARILTDDPTATPDEGYRWVAQRCQRFRIPPLRSYGLTHNDIPALVEKGARASSMKGNPIVLWGEELQGILALAI